jgi:hypothetical protein
MRMLEVFPQVWVKRTRVRCQLRTNADKISISLKITRWQWYRWGPDRDMKWRRHNIYDTVHEQVKGKLLLLPIYESFSE